MSFADVRHAYPLALHDIAGHEDGIEVYDAAYVMGKAPNHDLEWDDVQLTRKYEVAPLSSNATVTDDDDADADDDVTDLGQFMVDVHDWTTSIGDTQERHDPSPAHNEQLLQSKVYLPPVLQPLVYVPPDQLIRFIAEDAGSICNYANDSHADNELSLPIGSPLPPSPTTNITTIGREEYETLLEPEGYEPSHPITFLQQLAACLPNLPCTSYDRRDNLERTFQFPAQDGYELLSSAENVPKKTDTRQCSFGQLLNVFNEKTRW
jgi:hypothetical protein